MSSRNRGGKLSSVSSATSSPKGKLVSESSTLTLNQITHGVRDVNLDPTKDQSWEAFTNKPKSLAGSNASKPLVNHEPNPKSWGHPNVIQKLDIQDNYGSGIAAGNGWRAWPTKTSNSTRLDAGRGSARPGTESSHVVPLAVISAPQNGGLNWSSRNGEGAKGNAGDKIDVGNNATVVETCDTESDVDDFDDTESDVDDFDDDGDIYSDADSDSDTSAKSHDTKKKNKWFRAFFRMIDKLTNEDINEPSRQWHCPACHDGPGAIDWFCGLQSLISHAKNKGSQRVKLHREFEKILSEELRRRGADIVSSGEVFGQWKGLETAVKDHEIVWPPMVIIMNTKLGHDDNSDKWIGMGNQELLNCFSSYAAVKARHSYGPQGHRGMSILIFEASSVGYLEAERLHKHFETLGRDRYAWDHHPSIFSKDGGGMRQLYGYMALKEDLDIFNRHSHGKTIQKFEMRSYQEVVVNQMRQMSEDNQQLVMLKDKVAREKRHSKALEQSFGIVAEKLRKTTEESRIVRQRTKKHHEQTKEEMDFQEQFFQDQIKIIHDARGAKEDEFEKLQEQKRETVKQESTNASAGDQKQRTEQVVKFIEFQDREMSKFDAEREELLKVHEEKEAAMRLRHHEEKLELEKDLDAKLSQLMEKYTLHR